MSKHEGKGRVWKLRVSNVQIGTTDSTGMDLNQNLLRTRLRNRQLV
jgi:hypothetical protein